LLKNYNKLWVFGDSNATPGVCVDPADSFWGLTALALDIPTIKNCSRPANSFDSVCHMLVSLQSEYDWKRDLFLIGVPALERITVFDNYKDTEYEGHELDIAEWQVKKFKIASHHGLLALQNYGADKQLIIHTDRSWLETQVLRTIFLITTWLDSKNANYMIINLSKDLDNNNVWGPSEFVLPYALNHPRCILFEDTYHGINLDINPPADFDQYGWNGHHGPVGNKYFFENSLLPKIKQCGLI
jgi:hypothetical protein